MIKKISALAIVALFFTACESNKKSESEVVNPSTENTTESIEKAEAAVLKIEKSVNELDNLLNDIE